METIVPKPELFDKLCQRIGITLIVGQKLQTTYALYYEQHSKIERKLDDKTRDDNLQRHLNKPMGVVVGDIKKDAPFPEELSKKIDDFKDERNWLAHDFDQETRNDILQNRNLDLIIDRLHRATELSKEISDGVNKQYDLLMEKLGVSSEELTLRAINRIKSIANQRIEPTS